MTNQSKLVIHVPHASTFIPEDAFAEFEVSRDSLAEEAFVSADFATDQLAREAWPTAEIVEARCSRVVVDVERY